MRRLWVMAAVGLILVGVIGIIGWWVAVQRMHWPEWEAFAEGFIQDDGRVVDHTAEGRTVSEGQAYAAFFALVANDRERFDLIVDWAENNLSEGSFATRLPAWLWGSKDEGGWGVKDDNAASDADLWLSYTLFEAARLWGAPRYHEKATMLLDQVKAQEVRELPGIGPMLMPAPRGFDLDDGHSRLNPSYLAEFQLRYFQQLDPDGPWMAIWQGYLSLMQEHASLGLVPDWFEVDDAGRPVACRQTGNVGSYDAIRSYLWAAVTPQASAGQSMMPIVAQAAEWFRRGVAGQAAEKIDISTGEAEGAMPLGYAAAFLPFFHAVGDTASVSALQARLDEQRHDGQLGSPARYYDQVLALFGEGYLDQRFSFDGLGRLNTRWAH